LLANGERPETIAQDPDVIEALDYLSQTIPLYLKTNLALDPNFGSLISTAPGDNVNFNSKLMQDHPYHFGYYINAIGILAETRNLLGTLAGSTWLQLPKNRGLVLSLINDCANRNPNNPLFPEMRSYAEDGWMGAEPFLYNSNSGSMESSSEAIAFWVGVLRVGEILSDTSLVSSANVLLDKMAQNAESYFQLGSNAFEEVFKKVLMGFNPPTTPESLYAVGQIWNGLMSTTNFFQKPTADPHRITPIGQQFVNPLTIPFSLAPEWRGEIAEYLQKTLDPEIDGGLFKPDFIDWYYLYVYLVSSSDGLAIISMLNKYQASAHGYPHASTSLASLTFSLLYQRERSSTN
jgi:hypothetical protein